MTAGADAVSAGAGSGGVFGAVGHDTSNGEDGFDGGAGPATLMGGLGNDSLRVSFASDIAGLVEVLRGGSDDDTIRDALAADLLVGSRGADAVAGSDGADSLRGGQGADDLGGGTGVGSFQLLGISDPDGLAETIDGGHDSQTLDPQAINATGRIDLTFATIVNYNAVRLVGNVITLTTAQLGSSRRFRERASTSESRFLPRRWST